MRNSVSDVTDAEILDETREAMTQAAFDAADEANAAQAVESATESLPAFDELGLSDEMLRAIESLGYTAPTPVQAGSIPVVLEGRDLLAAAQTGTGKTAAFLLPTMNNLEHIAPPKPVRERGGRNRRRGAKKPEGNGRGPVMLVITPTRELAQQIDEVAGKIADVTGHVAVTVVGGVSYKPQTAALKYGCDILVATPGRLVDLIEQGACHLDEVKVLVLDEADRMLDMGFLPAVRRIVRETPAERQTLLFSATLDEEAVGEITDLVSDPARVEIAPATSTADTVDQFVFPGVHRGQEQPAARVPQKREGPERTIVFMRTKHRADSCCRRLERKGIKAAAIHGNRSQAQRERALSAFRDGTVDVLVATDVLARGIDISDVRYVVNFDVPAEPTDYIHRIGRTGRAGELGWAITFVTEQDVDEFYEIEKLMDKTADIYEAGDLHVGPNPPAVDPERDPAVFKVKKTKRGKSKSKKKLEQARRDGKRNGDDYGDVAGRSNRGRDERRGDGERPSRPKRGGKTRVREGVQARVDEAVESVAREVAAEGRGGATAVEQAPRGNRAERRAKQFQGEAHRRRREDEDRGGRRRVEREDEGRGSRGGSVARAIAVVPVAMTSAVAVMSVAAAKAVVRVTSVVPAAASPAAASALTSAEAARVAAAASVARALVATVAAAAPVVRMSRAIVATRVPTAIVAMTGATTTTPAMSVVAAIVAGVAATRLAPAAAVPEVAIIVAAMATAVVASAVAAPVAPATAAASANNIRIAR